MDNTTLILIVVAVITIIAITLAMSSTFRRRRRPDDLREKFGPEYDHLIAVTGDEKQAQMELVEREKRVMSLDIHPLDAGVREQKIAEWDAIQFDFVDEPGQTVERADRLIVEVMQERGYPKAEFEQRVADLSVNYPESANHYRLAQEITARNHERNANTEELRQAMIYFRTLFKDLMGTETIREKSVREKKK